MKMKMLSKRTSTVRARRVLTLPMVASRGEAQMDSEIDAHRWRKRS